MGCGTSSVGVSPDGQEGEADAETVQHKCVNGHATSDTKQIKKEKTSVDTNANRQDVSSNNAVPVVPKAIAFEVTLDDRKTANLIAKHPPRLKKLEPLNLPKLTPEMLELKQQQADEKRLMELQRKVSASRKSSKRRRELLKAREFEEQQQLHEQQEKLNEQQKLADMKREAKLQEIKERQRLKEERARRAREKAKRLQQGDQDVTLDVEKDEAYNNSDDDSWLDGENETIRKKIRPFDDRPAVSASTIDSFENAFQRPPGPNHAPSAPSDDFFDS